MPELLAKHLALLHNPFLRLPLAIWDASMFLTGNALDALRLYHGICEEILELINGA